MSIYQSNIYGKDLDWLHFENKQRGSVEAASVGLTDPDIPLCSLSNRSDFKLTFCPTVFRGT